MEEPSGSQEQPSSPSADVPQRVECLAAREPAVHKFIFAAMLLGLAAYCFIDHYVRGKFPYPGEGGDINAWARYIFNAYGPFVLGPPGLLLAIWGVVLLRRRLLADQEGVGYAGRRKVAWSDVKSLDTSRFDKKNILALVYESGGQEKRLVLDGWKLQNFKELVKLVETKVPS